MRIRISGSLSTLVSGLALSAALALILFGVQAPAQIAGTANVQGTVQDSSGAVVPNAAVTITDASTQVSHSTKSNSAGVYVFPGLITGTYNLSVTASGFQTYQQTGVVLEVGSSIAINVTLSVGRAETKIEVRSEGLALQTEDASYKQTIDSKGKTSATVSITGVQSFEYGRRLMQRPLESPGEPGGALSYSEP